MKRNERNIKEGHIFWSINQSIESEGYNVDSPATKPWQGKVTRTVTGFLGGIYRVWLSRFDKETGEVDDDSNATAIVNVKVLYKTEQEARAAYISSITKYLKDTRHDMDILEESLNKYKFRE